MNRTVVILAAGLGLASAASAQTAADPASSRTRVQVTQHLSDRFNAIDANRDGSLSKTEIEAAETRVRRQAAARIAKRAEESFARLDTDKNGQLSLAEFKASMPPVGGRAADGFLQRFDTDKDGKITLAEFGRPTLAVFDRLDTNRDGTISAQERAARRGSASRR